MSLTENQNEMGKAVRKVLNKPSEEISLLEDQDSQETSTPKPSKKASKRRSPKHKKQTKKRRYDFTSSDESIVSDHNSQVESAASSINEDEYDQLLG